MSINKMLCNLGVFDIPILQKQPDFVVDLLDANTIVFGASMSGKSTFLKNLINILHKQYNEKTEQIFILDFGGALAAYREMPLVAAYFDNSNEEYVKRVFKILENILKSNIRDLDGKNYRDAREQPIHTTFIIDNLNAFLDEPRYGAYQEKFGKLCRDGLSKGISIVVTAVETKGTGSFLGTFKQKVAFDMPADKYGEIFTGKVDQVGNNPGHGFANVTVKIPNVTGAFRMNLPYEVQCRFPYGAKGRADTDEGFLENLRKKFGYADGAYVRCVQKYQTFPKELTAAEYETLKQVPPPKEREPRLPVGVGLDYVDFYPVTVDMKESGVIAIYGKKEFGKTNLLRLLLKGAMEQEKNTRLVFLDDGRNQLRKLYEKYQTKADCVYFNGFAEETMMFLASKPSAPASRAAATGTAPRPAAAATKPAEEEPVPKKLSPLQRFLVYLNAHYFELEAAFLREMFGLPKESSRRPSPVTHNETPFTVFVIQSKLAYLNTREGKHFMEKILPRMASLAEENGYLFLFSDVQKINESETNTVFNNTIRTAFLLDNIAEFAGERGQKTVFGNMDIKSLKEDYARCELGDGYCYDIEADRLLKVKYIKDGEE